LGTCGAMQIGSCGSCGGLMQDCCGSTLWPFCTGSHLACSGFPLYLCKPCGLPGEICCDLGTCEGSGCCSGGDCVAAGDTGLTSSAICDQNVCVGSGAPCGALGQASCGGTCDQPYTIDSGSVCVPCGGDGQPCCGTSIESPCAEGFICDTFKCTPCGGSGQSCC